ncbi:MAG: hypothetical protein GEV12_00090 [Micromonosporaceae bacterium]|nr:hypothetical protein [Micromonosporaceae bacterium]
MRHPTPTTTDETAPFWQGAGEGALVLPRCTGCGRWRWPVASACPGCGAPLHWAPASGLGTVLTFTVVHRAASDALAADVPYVVALVALDEGVRLLSNVVGCAPSEVSAGRRVRVAFEPAEHSGIMVPVFVVCEPAGPTRCAEDGATYVTYHRLEPHER